MKQIHTQKCNSDYTVHLNNGFLYLKSQQLTFKMLLCLKSGFPTTLETELF